MALTFELQILFDYLLKERPDYLPSTLQGQSLQDMLQSIQERIFVALEGEILQSYPNYQGGTKDIEASWPTIKDHLTILKGIDQDYPEIFQPNGPPDPRKFTYLSVPQNKPESKSIQMGLFELNNTEDISQALNYISGMDDTVIHKSTGQIICQVSTQDRPDDAIVVIMTARYRDENRDLFKFYSNVKEFSFGADWMLSTLLPYELRNLFNSLKTFDYTYIVKGNTDVAAMLDYSLQVRSKCREEIQAIAKKMGKKNTPARHIRLK